MTIAPDEPDIAELDFEPEGIAGPDKIDEQTMAWAREQGGTYTYGSYGDPMRQSGSIGLAGAHMMPINGTITSDDLYAAVRATQDEERTMIAPRPADMGLMEWLANCSPTRGELLRTLQAADLTCTCHTWTSDEAT